MAEVTIVYWRDIPAQVIVGKGRRGAKVPLPERFEQAIDRAAMKMARPAPTPTSPNGARRPLPSRARTPRWSPRPRPRARQRNTIRRLKALIANDGAGREPEWRG